MKPHSLRRVLWLTNVALGVAVVGVLAWYVLEVRPKVAEATEREPNYQPPELKKLYDGYKARRQTGLMWTPEAPVSKEEIHEVILRKDYENLQPRHWIFCGPLPPEPSEEVGPAETGPPPPEGLAAIGSVVSVLLAPPKGSSIEFKFADKNRIFGIGDFVRASPSEPGRFKLTDVVEIRPRVYEVRYAVFGKDPEQPEKEDVLIWDRSPKDEYSDFLRPADLEPPAGAAAPADTGPGPVAGAGPGDAGTDEKVDGAEGPALDEPTETVIEVGTSAAEDLKLDDLRPTIHVDPSDRRRRAVEFDANTYDYFRRKNAKSIAETVKTAPAKDPDTGRILGLRITGFQADAPADVFDVRRGDILVSINGQKVTSRADAINIAKKLNPDSLVTVVIDRNGRLVTYTVDPRDPRNKRKIRYFENLK